MKCLLVVTILVALSDAASFDGRIVDGELAADGQFPYQVSLQRYGKHSCGGSILTNEWIITAAHCITKPATPMGGLMVVAGINKISDTHLGQSCEPEKVIVNKDYDNDNEDSANDVALIKLSTPLMFNSKVQPIQLNDEEFGASGLIFSGWGKTDNSATVASNDLLFYKLNSLTYEDCVVKIPYVTPKQVCTFTRLGQGACNGDSGGPLVYKGKLAGLASYVVDGCALGHPDVFTRVSSFLQWIHDNMQ